jgi:hypothetical protein
VILDRALGRIALFVCAVAAYAQTPSRQSPANGLEPAWDIAALLQEMSGQAARLLPALDKVDAQAWVERGASETYLAQLQSSKEQARALSDGAKALSRNPEKLAATLELFLRIEGLETMLRSLEEGIRKYQTPNVAETIASLAAAGGANRERLRRYMVNLAAERDHQFEVMDREAQRCRALLTQPARKTSGRKN